ncbi:MAG: flagellar basal body P-ring protein FlgI, partial [Phycisphaerales bacterium JB041]
MTRPLVYARLCLLTLACCLGLASPLRAQTITVREVARLSTEGGYDLQGIGLVMGLPGTGDSGKELAMARPLARVLELNGNAIPDLKQLEKTKSVALVMVTCRVPRGGARKNDQLDVTISTVGSAQSLEGGQLFVASLLGPVPGSPVFAMASGPVMLLDPDVPTTARVAGGAQIIRDLVTPAPDTHFKLVLEPHYRGYASAAQVATAINDNYFASPSALGMRVARAIDDREVLVVIPEGERPDPAPFVADIMITQLATELLKLPAR